MGSRNGAASRSEAVMDPETVTEAAAAATVGSLHWADWVVVVIYFILVLAVGLLVSEKRAPSPCIQEKRTGLARHIAHIIYLALCIYDIMYIVHVGTGLTDISGRIDLPA